MSRVSASFLLFAAGTRPAGDDDVESGHGGRTEKMEMPTLEERVADLEGRMKPDLREEMIRGFDRMREDMTRGSEQLRAEMTRGSELLRAEMTRGSELLRAEMTQGSELLRDEMARGFERTESRFERLESRVDRIEDRMHRQFTWIVGIQLTTMLTVIGVLAAGYFR